MDIYQSGIRPLLFSGLKADPEWLHQNTIQLLSWLSQSATAAQISQQKHFWQNASLVPLPWLSHQFQQSFCFSHPILEQTLWGLRFPNPVGLAAGFDKDGLAVRAWSSLGFGFAELGTVTLHPQSGNPRPRLFRLPQDYAALNRMGFNNQGATAMAMRLTQLRMVDVSEGQQDQAELAVNQSSTAISSHSLPFTPHPAIPTGINLGKSKLTPLESAAEDYLGSFCLLKRLGDYFVVNVSSPNTPGLRSLQATEQLEPILHTLQQENAEHKPLFIKIAPDLEWEAIASILQLAQKYNLAGIIATNTTISRKGLQTQVIRTTGKSIHEEAGGISGVPLRQRSTEVIRFIYQQTSGKLPIIGVGGIFTAADAWEKITAGATLLQIYTGWIYEGPWMVRRILEGLASNLETQGFTNFSEAVGIQAGKS